MINASGDVVSNYHKIHLFVSLSYYLRADLICNTRMSISRVVLASWKVKPPFPVTSFWIRLKPLQANVSHSIDQLKQEFTWTAVGQLTCYDIRFGEVAQILRKRGAELIAYPSAFTVRTGAAHWEPLIRARAIETQTYVIGAASVGMHTESRITWGHAMVLIPPFFAGKDLMCMLL